MRCALVARHDSDRHCLIASIAIRTDIPILHNDSDFNAISRHTELQTDL